MNRKTLSPSPRSPASDSSRSSRSRRPKRASGPATTPARPAAEHRRHRHLEVTKDGATTTIKNEGGKYKVTAPVAYAADEAAAKAAFEALGKMDVTDLVTEQKASRPSSRSTTSPASTWSPRRRTARSWPTSSSARSTGPGTMVRPSGKNDVWQATRHLQVTPFDKAPADWRDKSITTFTADRRREARRRQPRTAPSSRSRRPAPRRAARTSGTSSSSVKIDKLDNSVPNGIVSSLSSWKANDFADGAKPADAGLDAAGADRHRRAQGRQERHRAHRQPEGREGDEYLRQEGRRAPGLPGQEVQPRARRQAPDRVPRQDPLRHGRPPT